MNGDDGLREAIARALHADWHSDEGWDTLPDSVCGYYRRLADVTLAVPEVAALRAQAAAADRVRELHRSVTARADGRTWTICDLDGDFWPCDTIRALDGPPTC